MSTARSGAPPGGEIIDTSGDPFAAGAVRRGRIARLVFPFLTALLLVAAIIAITLYSVRLNRIDALKLTETVIAAIEISARREVEAYLAPPAANVAAIADRAADAGVTARGDSDRGLERALRRALERRPELAAAFVGDAEGDFLMVQRARDGFVTKRIAASGGPREVRWIERGADGAAERVRRDPADDFDPASRPWFAEAEGADGAVWSEVYRFFTTGALGVTVSVRVPGPPERPTTVAGADVEIAELGRFLGEFDLGAGGRAVIVEPDGGIVAVPPALLDPSDMAGDAPVPTVAGLDDPVLDEAFQRFRIARGSRGVVTIDRVRYLLASSSLAAVVGRDWWLLLIAPEREFVGFVADNARLSLLLSGIVVLLASTVAGLLAYQGLQSDRRAARARASESAVRSQTATLDVLAGLTGLADPSDDASLRRFAAVTADATGARRAAVWWRTPADDALVCLEAYDRDAAAHSARTTLRHEHLDRAWPLLTGPERAVVTADGGDPRTAPLRELYLAPAGVGRLESLPVVDRGRVLGALWLEDAPPPSSPADLRGLVAAMLAPRLARMREAAGPATAPTEVTPPEGPSAGPPLRGALGGARERRLLARTRRRDGTTAAALWPRLAVLHLSLEDAVGLARCPEDAPPCGLEQIVAAAEREADRLGVRFLQFAGDVVVAAQGFDDDAERPAAAAALADLALALQPSCRRIARRDDGGAGYRFGLDVGPAFGAAVGTVGTHLNLWGEAPRLAARLAETAPATGIQVSEAVYDRLATDYLLRRRGSFFLEGVGEVATFVLAGRL